MIGSNISRSLFQNNTDAINYGQQQTTNDPISIVFYYRDKKRFDLSFYNKANIRQLNVMWSPDYNDYVSFVCMRQTFHHKVFQVSIIYSRGSFAVRDTQCTENKVRQGYQTNPRLQFAMLMWWMVAAACSNFLSTRKMEQQSADHLVNSRVSMTLLYDGLLIWLSTVSERDLPPTCCVHLTFSFTVFLLASILDHDIACSVSNFIFSLFFC